MPPFLFYPVLLSNICYPIPVSSVNLAQGLTEAYILCAQYLLDIIHYPLGSIRRYLQRNREIFRLILLTQQNTQ